MVNTDNLIRVLLANIDDVEKLGLYTIFSTTTDICIVGETKNNFEIPNLILHLKPDVLIIDPDKANGQVMIDKHWIGKISRKTNLIFFSNNDHACCLSKAIESGVKGYIEKGESVQILLRAIYLASKGNSLFTEEQFNQAYKWQAEVGKRVDSLTKREYKALCYLSKGMSNRAIAEEMSVSIKTIETYVANILEALELTSRSEVICWLYENVPDNYFVDFSDGIRDNPEK